MRPHILLLFVTFTAPLWTAMATAQEKAGQPEQLGQVHFSVSCTAAAQQEFDRAMALLHSFEFRKAEKAFKRVTEIEPGCAMGHWGIAMRWFSNPLGGPPSRKALQDGWAAVEQAKAIGAHTARERDYIATLETFYKDADTRDHRTRALAYEQAMQQLSLQYPEDREAAILYALALNMTALPTDKTYANQLKAAEILDHVFAELPHHPGVAHYLIHTYDYPALASRGLPAARRYASIAPSSPHALHMPAHIFTRLGLWQESIDANRASATAGKEYAAQAHPGVASNYQPHAMDYMMYAYLQGARDKAAGAVLEELSEIRKVDVEGRGSAYAFAAIPARYALERRRWADAMALTVQPTDFPWTRFPEAEAVTYFARALGAARSGDAAAARQDIDRLKALHHALIEAKRDYWVEQVEIQHHVAAAWVARIEGKNDEALQLMRSAADREDATEKHIVTPGPLFPARELLGELLLELNEPAQALQEFEASIHKEPNRFNGAYGAARAAELVGNREKAKAYYAKLLALCEQADTERPALQQAKAFLAK